MKNGEYSLDKKILPQLCLGALAAYFILASFFLIILWAGYFFNLPFGSDQNIFWNAAFLFVVFLAAPAVSFFAFRIKVKDDGIILGGELFPNFHEAIKISYDTILSSEVWKDERSEAYGVRIITDPIFMQQKKERHHSSQWGNLVGVVATAPTDTITENGHLALSFTVRGLSRENSEGIISIIEEKRKIAVSAGHLPEITIRKTTGFLDLQKYIVQIILIILFGGAFLTSEYFNFSSEVFHGMIYGIFFLVFCVAVIVNFGKKVFFKYLKMTGKLVFWMIVVVVLLLAFTVWVNGGLPRELMMR